MKNILKKIGPGILLAGAAIGVSHLIQATRAGAEYGFSLFWVLVLACLSKYPFMEFGSRYSVATGNNLIEGYRKMGRAPYWIFIFITVGTMFIIQAAVTIVTAGLAEQFFNTGWSTFTWSVIILAVCIALLWIGKYKALDWSMKGIISVLAVLTLICVGVAFFNPASNQVFNQPPPSYWNITGLGFIIAFMGWMPIPVDAAVWHSVWVGEKKRQGGLNYKLDFNLGYGAAVLLGVIFLLLGALMMFGSGISFSGSSVEFAGQLVGLYEDLLGQWSGTVVGFAAFITMFSTTLTVIDAYPRVFKVVFQQHRSLRSKKHFNPKNVYRYVLILSPIIALSILYGFNQSFTYLVDFAAGLSFVAAPVLAYFNFKLIRNGGVPKKFQLSRAYRIFSWACLFLLFIFGLVYLVYILFL